VINTGLFFKRRSLFRRFDACADGFLASYALPSTLLPRLTRRYHATAARGGDDEDRIERRGDSLIVERWRRRQHDHIEFNVYWTRAWLGPGRYPGRPGRVLLGSHGKTVEVGGFLAEDERKRLLESIRTVLTSVQARPS